MLLQRRIGIATTVVGHLSRRQQQLQQGKANYRAVFLVTRLTGIFTPKKMASTSSSATQHPANQEEPLAEEVSKTTVAIGQMRSTKDKAANMRQVEELCSRAQAQAATFLFLPECCDFVGEHRQQTLELSEPLTGDTVQQYRALAQRYQLWLSLGGIHESILDEAQAKTEKIFNAHILLNPAGELVSVYRKLHLFDVDTPEFRFRESDIVAPGPRLLPPVATPLGRLGLQICYDVRFGEAAIALRKLGAQVLTYPSAFAFTTGQAHWEVLLRARAIETQSFVIAAAQVGYHNAKRRSWGHAMIVSPWGKVLADCGPDEELALATAEVDLAAIAAVQRSMPCFQHRRRDVYGLTSYATGQLDAPADRLFAEHVIRKETIFYESLHCFCFTNLRCVVAGHVLVATKRCTPRLNGLSCEEITDLFATVCQMQRMLEQIHGTTAATVTVQDGAMAGQTVPHVHFHVLPRRLNDFKHNDEVYVQMDDRCLDKDNRSMEERIDEATIYREFLRKERAD